jgi:two-component system phosphate regulon sensor histidine kinase PhoR
VEVARERLGAKIGTWSDELTRVSLQVLAEGAAVLSGFGQAAIRVRRGDVLEVIAISGPDLSEMLGTSLPVGVLEGELEKSDAWGDLRFVPHERVGDEVLEYSHVLDMVPLDVPDAWHPLDLLVAPFYDDEATLRGLLTVDAPDDGRRPGPQQREVLARYARVARSSVLLALEREQLGERVRLATEARDVVRLALGEPSLDLVIEACRSAVVSAFDAEGMWLSALGADGGVTTTWYSELGQDRPPFEELGDLAIGLARIYWRDQYVAHFSRARTVHPALSPEQAETLVDFLDRIGIGSILFVPMGIGRECLGFLVLSRVSDSPAWTTMEYEAARDIGRDLGRAVANARQRDAERVVVNRLRELDGYRVELVNTVAHELRSPLTSVAGHLELLEDEQLSADGQRSIEAAIRGTRRLERVIDDLLTMARLSDPKASFDPVRVDLLAVIQGVQDECARVASSASVAVSITLPTDVVEVSGCPDELHRMLVNLLSNAVKYSDAGSPVEVRVEPGEGNVVLSVVDHGLGISEEDQRGLFSEFFRSTNPAAYARPGTGLGLVIVDRIVGRHGGHIAVDSELGRGTTVSVTLPTWSEPG